MLTTHVRGCGLFIGLALIVGGLALKCRAAAAEADPLARYVCRIACDNGDGSTSYGTGTIVFSRSPYRAVVLTNAHVVRDSPGGPFTVTFADGEPLPAKLMCRNDAIDMASLEIPFTGRQAATWRGELPSGVLHGYGFASGQLARLDGQATGSLTAGAQESVTLSTQFREGDSGGPVFDDAGVMCGVIWGTHPETGGVMVHPKHLVAFLEPLTRVPEAPAGVQPTQWSSCGPGGRPPQYSSCPPGVICGQPLLPNMPRIIRPTQPAGVPVNATPITAPPQSPGQLPPTQSPGARCECAPKWAALESRLTAIETTRCPAGPAGPAGPPGPAGKDGASIDEAALAARVAALVMKQMPLPSASGSAVSHYVLVADDGADYWPRLADEFRRARESYSGLRVSGVPDVPVGPLPQLVAYRDGKPMGAFRGRRDVSDALVRIVAGKAPLP
jgi:hypothetical protein